MFSSKEHIYAIESELPSIPIRYWLDYAKIKKNLQNTTYCTKFLNIFKHLVYQNTYWQTTTIEEYNFQLYTAYYDQREELEAGPVVRVLAMINATYITKKFYCQLWYDDSTQPDITLATDFQFLWPTEKKPVPKSQLYPNLFNCQLKPMIRKSKRKPLRIPKAISLVANNCDTATNALRIQYDPPPMGKEKFAICIKSLNYFEDFSARLVEWIELQLLLGASKIFFYHLSLHPNVSKALKYYEQKGFVDIRSATFAEGYADLRHVQYFMAKKQQDKANLNNQIFKNDCFYRNIYRYEYIAMQDIDEVLMPLGNYANWSDLMTIAAEQKSSFCPNGYGSYCLRNVNFLSKDDMPPYTPDLPQFMFLLQHVEREIEISDADAVSTACFHRTASSEWYDPCPSMVFNLSEAQMQQYRSFPVLENTIIDPSVWRFKKDLMKRSLDALKEMGFLEKLKNHTSL